MASQQAQHAAHFRSSRGQRLSLHPLSIPNDGEPLKVPSPRIAKTSQRLRCAYTPAAERFATPTAPTQLDPETIRRTIPPYRVILHNDDHNSMDHVVRSIIHSVPSLGVEEATHIMFEAHNHGQATVIVCAKEEAEYYRERLESCGLTATIEPA